MPRLSKLVEKLEDRLSGKWGRWYARHKAKLPVYIPLGLGAWYLYGMFVNSLRLGKQSVFNTTGEVIESIWVFNPFKNLIAPFTPFGLGVTAVIVLLICLITKKGYSWLSGYKFVKDKRGFDILPDGTHGTSGFMDRRERARILETGPVEQLTGTVLGKYKDDPDDDDKYAEYVTLKKGSGLTEHTMVYGATGAGKSRGFVKPFILQCAKRGESLILVDPKGEFYESMSGFLRDEGYEVRLFNLLDMENSDAWNCLADATEDPNLVQSIAEVIINNTSNSEERQDFWSKAELNLLVALIHYVIRLKGPDGKLCPIHERSLGAIYRLLSSESFQSLEEIMNGLPKDHPARAPYGIFKLANRQIWGNIAIGLGNRLAVFQNPLVDKITAYNEIDMTLPGRKPCAYFCAISDQDSSLEFLSSLFFSQLFSRLMSYARREGTGGRLPVTVNVCLEEFCNIGKLVDFKKAAQRMPQPRHPLPAHRAVHQPALRPLREEGVGGTDRQLRHPDLPGLQRPDDGEVHLGQVRLRHHPGQQQPVPPHAAVLPGLLHHPPLLPDPQQHPAGADAAGRDPAYGQQAVHRPAARPEAHAALQDHPR